MAIALSVPKRSHSVGISEARLPGCSMIQFPSLFWATASFSGDIILIMSLSTLQLSFIPLSLVSHVLLWEDHSFLP